MTKNRAARGGPALAGDAAATATVTQITALAKIHHSSCPHQCSPASGGRRQSGWAAAVKKKLCNPCDSLCLSVYLPVFVSLHPHPVTLSPSLTRVPLRPHCVLADCWMKGSWCQSLSWGSGSCQHHSAVLLSSVEEGLGALKAQCIEQTLFHTSQLSIPLSGLL